MSTNTLLRKNTFHHSDFSDIAALVAEKKKKKLKISVCIPTLNEEKTIGKEIVILRSELVERFALIDELVVIDSGSEDKTLDVANQFGAETYLSADILPEEGFKRGKGENLWKAVYQLTGDIIVYIDADISNIHPRFIYGLVGPLIKDDKISYVKGFYDRPLNFAGKLRPSGGGRVTEIMTRPFFSMFFPELSAIIQPLSGEYAIRRNVAEAITFPVGYGVETSHLIDVHSKWGIDVFAQVDLDLRVHRNQDTLSLGRMAFAILQTMMNRLQKLGRIEEQELATILYQFEVLDDEYNLKEFDWQEFERPPMNTIKGYQEKFPVKTKSKAKTEST